MSEPKNNVVPLGGRHMSARSLLAEAMSDPELNQCVLVCFGESGDYGVSHFGMTRERICFAAELVRRLAFDE